LYVKIADQAIPSVANINTTQEVRRRMRRGGGGGGWPFGGGGTGDPFFDFFGGFPGFQGGPGGGGGNGFTEDRIERPQSLGTGFVFEKEGTTAYLLTNNHVIDGADKVYVKFTENKEEKQKSAEVIGADAELDVAILKVKNAGDVRALPLGNSDALKVGEWVAAIGNPFGHGHSMSHGIVSAKARGLPGGWGKYLQTDAPINPGNSGGPLLNLRGEVIGINNAIDARGPGIGFAIPVNAVKAILGDLKKGTPVERGYIGISMAPLEATQLYETSKKYPPEQPVVAQVQPQGPAYRAGIRSYDIVVEVAGRKIETSEELLETITAAKVGTMVNVVVDRDGQKKSIDVKVVKRPGR
jgi:serine protease Do